MNINIEKLDTQKTYGAICAISGQNKLLVCETRIPSITSGEKSNFIAIINGSRFRFDDSGICKDAPREGVPDFIQLFEDIESAERHLCASRMRDSVVEAIQSASAEKVLQVAEILGVE